MKMKLKYCSREFDLDIEGISSWLNSGQKRSSLRLDGAWGHPSDAGWNAPCVDDYFLGMSVKEIVEHILSLSEGETILERKSPNFQSAEKLIRLFRQEK